MSAESLLRRIGEYDVLLYKSAIAAKAGGELDAGYSSPGFPPHRVDWLDAVAEGERWWLAVRDTDQRAVAGYAVSVIPTRSLPGHRQLRVDRLRFAPDPGPAEAAARYLVELARRDGRTLTLTVEPFFADGAERDQARAALDRAGFRRAGPTSMYANTLRIDLRPEPEEILSRFHSTARRHIRAVTKRPVEIRVVDDVTFGTRLGEILSETFDRTSGPAAREPWPALIEYSRAHPEIARLVSLVRTDRTGPEALVAFALGLNHGDHVEYATAGSTRPADLRMPFGYALAWDLMGWARAIGAPWFDFGGIVAAPAADDERQGIHEFKRNFSDDVIEVREAWVFEARPIRSAFVRRVSALAEIVRKRARSRPRPGGNEEEPVG